MRALAISTALIAVILCATPARVGAHTLSRSVSEWRVEADRVVVTARLPVVELARMRPDLMGRKATGLASDPATRRWITGLAVAGLRADLPEGACSNDAEPTLWADDPGHVTLRWALRCDPHPPPALRCDLFFDRAPSHLHLLRVVGEGLEAEAALTTGRRRTELLPGSSERRRPSFLRFLETGMVHVAGGWDHMAFVVALMLLGGGLLQLAGIATGFTLGHSVSLGLAAAGVVRSNSALVETMVGLSTAYVALECFYVWAGRSGRRRILIFAIALCVAVMAMAAPAAPGWSKVAGAGAALFCACHLLLHSRGTVAARQRMAVAILFGLVHGLAFAGAFAEELEGASLLVGLVGFNAGIELAQLCVVLVTVSALRLTARLAGPKAEHAVAASTAALVLAAGLAWTFERALSAGGYI
jgi:hypothetical protein